MLFALFSNTTGLENTATGSQALLSNNGSGNTANGDQALHKNATGDDNTATGNLALFYNTTGNNNTANGAKRSLATPPATATPPLGG